MQTSARSPALRAHSFTGIGRFIALSRFTVTVSTVALINLAHPKSRVLLNHVNTQYVFVDIPQYQLYFRTRLLPLPMPREQQNIESLRFRSRIAFVHLNRACLQCC